MQGLLARFASQAGLWQRAVKGMAELDALMALGFAAQFGGDGAPMCRPTFIEPQASETNPASTGHVSLLFQYLVILQMQVLLMLIHVNIKAPCAGPSL